MLIDKLIGEPPALIRKIQIIKRGDPTVRTTFRSQEDYFQFGIAQVHIKKLQAFLKDYSPLVYSNLKYQVGSRQMESTHVVDPCQDKSGAAGRLLLGYQPIITPVPFINNDIQLTIALLRLQVADYVPAAVNLLTSVASVILPDFKMSDKISGTLNNGVNDLIKDATSFVVGWRGSASSGEPLTSGYTLLTNDPDVDPENLFVLNDMLMIGDEPETAIPFNNADFLMFRVDRLDFRNDYLTVEPIASLYEKALGAIRDDHVDALTEIHSGLRRAVMSAAHFTLSDAKRITTELTNDIKQRWEAQKAQPEIFKNEKFNLAREPIRVSDAEFEAAMDWTPIKQ